MTVRLRTIIRRSPRFGISSSSSAPGDSDAAITTAFLARTSGLDATHTNAYKAFINGLVTDGLATNATWGKFDCIWLTGTQDSTTAKLNLPNASYNLTTVNSPAFAADAGYTGGTTKYLSTAFIPSTASGNFTQNAASYGAYCRTARTGANFSVMGVDILAGSQTEFDLWWSDNNRYFALNGTAAGDGSAAATAGSWFVNRSSSSATQIYRNGSSYTTGAETSAAIANLEFYILAYNFHGTVGGDVGNTDQIAAAWIGGNFSGTEMTNFQNRLNTFATTLGWNVY